MSELRQNSAITGLNLDSNPSDIKQGQVSYSLNAVVEGFDGKSVAYQNEQGLIPCGNLPQGLSVIGTRFIPERNMTVYFLTDNTVHEIGVHDLNNCTYKKIVGGECLNFHTDFPIHKSVIKVISEEEVEIYWADARNPMRYLNIDNPPYITQIDDCEIVNSDNLDCNKLNVQPKVSIPKIVIKDIVDGGDLLEGTYQFAVQYANGAGEPYTSFYLVTNPVSIGNPSIVSSQFNGGVDKSIVLNILNIDNSGIYEYMNIAVVKKVNNIPSIELVDTFRISGDTLTIHYTGQSKQDIRLSANDLFERFTQYSKAGDVVSTGDIIIWSDLTSKERVNYQKIWRDVRLNWESWRVPYESGDTYALPENTFMFKGYMRDEIYALEGAFLFDDGTTSDYFHIPSRPPKPYDLEVISNEDSAEKDTDCDPAENDKPRWKVYNTASVLKKLTPNCKPTNPTTPTPPSGETSLSGKFSISCSDNGCRNQGLVSLKIELNAPLPNEVLLNIGQIKYEPLVNSTEAVGFNMFTLPAGVTPDTYYNVAGAGVPFQVKLPAGVTTITIPENILQVGQIYNPPNSRSWICHGCLFPIKKIYLQGVGVNINFTTDQDYDIINLHSGPVTTVPVEPVPPSVNDDCLDDCYKGPYEYGEFAYHESTDTYPCDEEIWGELANKPIRHHKFPDCLISPHHDNKGNIYPIGIRLDVDNLKELIKNSDLTDEQKNRIVGFTIGRGNRAANKTVVAKGLLYNIGVYKKEDQEYYYPNYPYNDLREDPFVLSNRLSVGGSTGAEETCYNYEVQAGTPNRDGNYEGSVTIEYVDCERVPQTATFQGLRRICALDTPQIVTGVASITVKEKCGTPPPALESSNEKVQLSGFETDLSKERFTFHSPDTHFYQPFLGGLLKIETIEHGISQGHFVQVRNHAKYGFISKDGYVKYIIPIANLIGFSAGWDNGVYGGGAITLIAIFSAPTYDPGRAVITVFQSVIALIELAEKIIPKINFAYQFNSIGRYNEIEPVQNSGNKVRRIDFSQYVISGYQSVGENRTLNNFNRESSVYLRVSSKLPFTHELAGPQDRSRWILSEERLCDEPTKIQNRPIASYYASIKKDIANPYGTLYSYETISTGHTEMFQSFNQGNIVIFGGDVFINKFALKRKMSYFYDNRVNFPDQADIDYRDFANIGYPKYWISTDYTGGGGQLSKLYGIKENSFDCQDDKFIYQKGKFYLFNYGIPYFFCESEVNVDLRKATNGKEGDYYPRVSSSIPDEWLQEVNVPIVQDNTYNYNKTFSTQNKENVISHLPEDFDPSKDSFKYLPNRCFYSDPQGDYVNYKRNNWLIYRPLSYFDFPLNYGKLISIESLENRAILARFETKSLIYNALLTAPTSAGELYVGKQIFNKFVPPLDFAETTFGFNGTLNKMFIKTEHGNISVDSKKGQVFLIKGQSIEELSSQKYNCSKFFSEALKFKILDHFNIPVDNHFKGLGLHGVYDLKNDRIIITKFDYEPIVENIQYINGKFYHNSKEVSLLDTSYFCNRSFTISFSFILGAWVSFHSYIPEYYVGTGNHFLSGIDNTIWKHNKEIKKYNHVFGETVPFIVEYPFQYKVNDEIIQSVTDYTKVLKYDDYQEFIEVDNIFFNKAIIYNNQQCSSIELVNKEKNNMSSYIGFPKYTGVAKQVLFTKSGSMYNYNSISDQVKDRSIPFWKKPCSGKSLDKELRVSNIEYTRKSFKEGLIRGKEAKIRHILDNTSDYRFISQFILTTNQNSFR